MAVGTEQFKRPSEVHNFRFKLTKVHNFRSRKGRLYPQSKTPELGVGKM